MAEAGFVAIAPDYLRDSERIKPGRRPYDTTDFYNEFPDWSIHGKDVWDTMRAIDYLETLDIVDRAAIIHEGQVLFEGSPNEILQNEDVKRFYLGQRYAS